MTSETRAHIRARISELRLAQHQRWAELNPTKACRGCGMPLDTRTPGCAPCADRDHRRAKRQRDGQACAGGCGATVQPPKSGKYWMRWTGLCRACYRRHLKERAA